MTIEKSPSPSANATSNASPANRSEGKGKAGSDDGSGGFGAILGAIDNAPAATDPAADSASDAGKGKSAKDAAAVDPNTLLQQNPQIAAAQAQQAADAAGAAALHPQATGMAGGDAAALAQQAALNAGQAAGPQQANALSALPGQGAAGAARARGTSGAADSTVALDGAAPANSTATQALLQSRAKAGKETLQAGTDASSQAAAGASSPSANQSAASERADAAKFLASLQQAQSLQGSKPEQSSLAALVAKSDKPQSERSSSTVKSADPTYSGTALGVSSPDFSLPSTSQVGAVPPEMQVAEQVSYWVSQNVQNAELKLDGLGQDPVAVSISVQGNEAQIAFRSDESATRDILQNSGAQLKDMLQREGLVLTGVSVGSSGSGGAQAREQGARQGLRQTQIAPLQATSQDSTPRVRSGMVSASGRSVDLFV